LKGFGEKMDRGSLGRTRQERWTDRYKSGQIHLKKTNPHYQRNFKKKKDFSPSEVELLGHLQRGDHHARVAPEKIGTQRSEASQKRMAAVSETIQIWSKSGLCLRGRGWHAASSRVRLLASLGPAIGGGRASY
jgi:hypothetical protein